MRYFSMLNDILSYIFSSVFEAWYIKEHVEKLQLPTDWIPKTFADTTFFNGLAAILAGLVANAATETLGYGPTAPFLIAVACLSLALLTVTLTWTENYGDQETDLIEAYKVSQSDIISSSVDGALHATPQLAPAPRGRNFGQLSYV